MARLREFGFQDNAWKAAARRKKLFAISSVDFACVKAGPQFLALTPGTLSDSVLELIIPPANGTERLAWSERNFAFLPYLLRGAEP
jgi:hypothetical protein